MLQALMQQDEFLDWWLGFLDDVSSFPAPFTMTVVWNYL